MLNNLKQGKKKKSQLSHYSLFYKTSTHRQPGMVVHICDPNEAKAGGLQV